MTCTRRPHSVWTRCPCTDCRREQRRIHKLHTMGRYRRPSSAQATVRVIGWRREGYTCAWIASACDVPRRFVEDIVRDFRDVGPRKIGPRRAAAILKADIATATEGYGPVGPSRDLLRALATCGHGLQEVADVSGVPLMTLSVIRAGKVAQTGPQNVRAIRAAYRELARKPGPAQNAAKRARAQGWPTVLDVAA
jgi:hypothetical protein